MAELPIHGSGASWDREANFAKSAEPDVIDRVAESQK
jgi:hypothetical protein